jgi:hypothetical protein
MKLGVSGASGTLERAVLDNPGEQRRRPQRGWNFALSRDDSFAHRRASR